jgi:hypothetical protein
VESKIDGGLLNNAAYVIAMSGAPRRAIALLEAEAERNPILKATLGLSYLAAGDVHEGMRLYREAAAFARPKDHELRSLMTAHQALVVRQLGLDNSTDEMMLAALALPPVDLPDDWSQRPEFLRLQSVSKMRGYPWPLSI